jgi:hypothetical protein
MASGIFYFMVLLIANYSLGGPEELRGLEYLTKAMTIPLALKCSCSIFSGYINNFANPALVSQAIFWDYLMLSGDKTSAATNAQTIFKF